MLWRRKKKTWEQGTEKKHAGVTVLKHMVREGFAEMLILEQSQEGERASHADIWREDGWKSQDKGHGVAVCLAHSHRVRPVRAGSRNEVREMKGLGAAVRVGL